MTKKIAYIVDEETSNELNRIDAFLDSVQELIDNAPHDLAESIAINEYNKAITLRNKLMRKAAKKFAETA